LQLQFLYQLQNNLESSNFAIMYMKRIVVFLSIGSSCCLDILCSDVGRHRNSIEHSQI
jgi:hypothetical protein